MRISDWSSDVCSSDLLQSFRAGWRQERLLHLARGRRRMLPEAVEIIVCEPAEVSKTAVQSNFRHCQLPTRIRAEHRAGLPQPVILQIIHRRGIAELRSEEQTSELKSLMRNSYAVFCLKKKKK